VKPRKEYFGKGEAIETGRRENQRENLSPTLAMTAITD